MRNTITLALTLVLSTLFVAAPASAVPVPLFSFSVGQPNTNTFGSFNIGNEFQTGPNLYVSAIGAKIHPSQISLGLTTLEYRGLLYSTTDLTTPLFNLSIPAGTAVDSQEFAYTPLLTTLNAGSNYVVTSFSGVNGQSNYSYNNTGASAGTWGSGVTLIRDHFVTSFGIDLSSSSTNGGFDEFLGGNLLVDLNPPPAPEPSSFLLLGLGMLGLSRHSRRRRNGRA